MKIEIKELRDRLHNTVYGEEFIEELRVSLLELQLFEDIDIDRYCITCSIIEYCNVYNTDMREVYMNIIQKNKHQISNSDMILIHDNLNALVVITCIGGEMIIQL